VGAAVDVGGGAVCVAAGVSVGAGGTVVAVDSAAPAGRRREQAASAQQTAISEQHAVNDR
jgi:hypothetical protein